MNSNSYDFRACLVTKAKEYALKLRAAAGEEVERIVKETNRSDYKTNDEYYAAIYSRVCALNAAYFDEVIYNTRGSKGDV